MKLCFCPFLFDIENSFLKIPRLCIGEAATVIYGPRQLVFGLLYICLHQCISMKNLLSETKQVEKIRSKCQCQMFYYSQGVAQCILINAAGFTTLRCKESITQSAVPVITISIIWCCCFLGCWPSSSTSC